MHARHICNFHRKRFLIAGLLGACSLFTGTATSFEPYLTHTSSLFNDKYGNENCFNVNMIRV
jgi:hypothetical protein